jgi:hypothetical protein
MSSKKPQAVKGLLDRLFKQSPWRVEEPFTTVCHFCMGSEPNHEPSCPWARAERAWRKN